MRFHFQLLHCYRGVCPGECTRSLLHDWGARRTIANPLGSSLMSKYGTLIANLVRAHPDFETAASIDGTYGHMGATLTDGVLQAGINDETVVRTRVKKS